MTDDTNSKTNIYKAILVMDYLLLIYIIIVFLVYISVKFTSPQYLIANNNTDYEGKPYQCWNLEEPDCNIIGGWVYPNQLWIRNENKFLYNNIQQADTIGLFAFMYLIPTRIYLFWRKKKNAISNSD